MFGNVGELSMFGGALWRFGHCLKPQRAIKREFAGSKSSLRHSLDFSLSCLSSCWLSQQFDDEELKGTIVFGSCVEIEMSQAFVGSFDHGCRNRCGSFTNLIAGSFQGFEKSSSWGINHRQMLPSHFVPVLYALVN